MRGISALSLITDSRAMHPQPKILDGGRSAEEDALSLIDELRTSKATLEEGLRAAKERLKHAVG